MFAQGLNQCRDYSSVDSKPCSFDDLLARNFKIVNVVYPAIKWKLKKFGDRYCQAKNKEKKTKGFKNGDFVMKLVDKWERMQQSEGEKVWIFRGRVQMFLNALGFDPSVVGEVMKERRRRERERLII